MAKNAKSNGKKKTNKSFTESLEALELITVGITLFEVRIPLKPADTPVLLRAEQDEFNGKPYCRLIFDVNNGEREFSMSTNALRSKIPSVDYDNDFYNALLESEDFKRFITDRVVGTPLTIAEVHEVTANGSTRTFYVFDFA